MVRCRAPAGQGYLWTCGSLASTDQPWPGHLGSVPCVLDLNRSPARDMGHGGLYGGGECDSHGRPSDSRSMMRRMTGIQWCDLSSGLGKLPQTQSRATQEAHSGATTTCPAMAGAGPEGGPRIERYPGGGSSARSCRWDMESVKRWFCRSGGRRRGLMANILATGNGQRLDYAYELARYTQNPSESLIARIRNGSRTMGSAQR